MSDQRHAASTKLFVFDYDHTIVCDNSDTLIPELLDAKHGIEFLNTYRRGMSWTDHMDRTLDVCQKKDGKSVADIAHAATKVPCFPELLTVLRLVEQLGPVHVVSDANSLYIESFLTHNHIGVSSIHTNPAEVECGVLRVRPYSAKAPHSCNRCPVNMCKGSILEDHILPTLQDRPRIFYFGDGSNDYCPVVRVMQENDVVFVRDDPSEPRARGLINRIQENPNKIRATIVRWASGKDLLDVLQRHVLK